MTTSIIRDIQTTIRIWISSRLADLTVYSLMVCSTTRSKDITWETSNSFNVGVDFALLGGTVIDGTIEYFNRQTKDMLYYKPVAISNGYTNFYEYRFGTQLRCKLKLNYTPIETNDLKWVINWNGTLMKNKILELHPDLKGEMIDGSYIYREGESLYQMYLTKYAGVDPDSGEALY